MNAIAKLGDLRIPIDQQTGERLGVNPDEWRVLTDQIFPAAKSVDSISMALTYCKARNLDIFKKPVHIVPMWSSAKGRMVETVWPGISEIRTTAARTGEYAGIDEVEFGATLEREFSGRVKEGKDWKDVKKTVRFPEWAKVTVYRVIKGQKCAFHAKVFWLETYASTGKSDIPNSMWERRAFGQLDKCVEAAALRKAFPEELGSVYAAEEMAGQIIDHDNEETPPAIEPPPIDDIDESQAVGDGVTDDTAAIQAAQDAATPPEIEGEIEPEFDFVAWLQELETCLIGAHTHDDLAQAWSDMDVEQTLGENADQYEIAMKVKDRFAAEIEAKTNPLNAG